MLKTVLYRVGAVLLFIIVVILIAFFAMKVLPAFFSFVSRASSSMFSKNEDSLQITVSKTPVSSGEAFDLSWDTVSTTTSSTISYSCIDDLSLVYVGSMDTKVPMICGKDFRVGGNTNSAKIIATLNKTGTFADAEITVKSEDAEEKELSGTTIVTVNSKALVAPLASSTATVTVSTSSKPATYKSSYIPSYNSYSTTPAPVYTGIADIYVSNAEVMYVGYSAVLKFYVSNIGGENSGPWSLLATTADKLNLIESKNIPSLSPGQTIEYTLDLGTVLRNGNYSIVIYADSLNQVIESNENNNSASTIVTIVNGQSGSQSSVSTSGNKPDLTVDIKDADDRGNDEFQVVFEVTNIGGATAKDWRFEAELPTDGDETYRSSEQNDLVSGGSVTFTLRFDNAEDGTFKIEVDSENNVSENKENNNTDTVRINN